MSGKKIPQPPRMPMMRCPHCGTRSLARTSAEMTEIYREITYQCRNVECGFTWVAGLAAVRELSPSGTPNPKIKIPPSVHKKAKGAAK